MHLTIIGAGRVGTAVGRLAVSLGLELRGVLSRTPFTREPGAGLPYIHALHRDTHVTPDGAIILCLHARDVPSAISTIQTALGQAFNKPATLSGILVAHTSGAHASGLLDPLRALGAHCATIHPIQSIPRPDIPVDRLRGISCGIETDDAGIGAAEQLARMLTWNPIRLHAGRMPLYHAACALAGNTLPAILGAAEQLLAAASTGLSAPTAFPAMAQSVLAEYTRAPDEALTGPVARADVDVLASQLEQLRLYVPALRPLYREVISLIAARARLTESQHTAVLDLLSQDAQGDQT